MINIDGSEGGGQILRTSVSLSALTNKPVQIRNIRGSRPTPGLKEQHLKGLKLISKATNGKLENADIGSTKIKFYPGEEIKNDLTINVSTAGSIGLILQEIMILATKEEIDLEINGGGTYVKWAPPVDYLKEVFLPLISKSGYKGHINTIKEGFYPKGGGKVKLKAEGEIGNIHILEKGKVENIDILSKASEHLRDSNVAERQANAAEKLISKRTDLNPSKRTEYVESNCPGSGILIKCRTTNSILGADSLGERGKRSESIGEEAAEEILNYIDRDCTVDKHMADNIIPYMGFSEGKSSVRIPKVTDHVETNMETVEKFLPVKFDFKNGILYKEDL